MKNELEALIKGLDWLLRAQKLDGGWSAREDEIGSSIQSTYNVIFVLIQIFGIELDLIEKGLNYIESKYIKNQKEIGFWPTDLHLDKPNYCTGLHCCYVLLLAERLGRELTRIKREDLVKSANDIIKHYIKKARSGEIIDWALPLCSLLLSFDFFNQKVRDEFKNIIIDLISDKSWSLKAENHRYAQAILGLLYFPGNYSQDLAHSALESLLERKIVDNRYIYWPHKKNPFIATRWVLWALIESFKMKIIRGDDYRNIISKSISWIVDRQNQEGFWVRSEGPVFEPNYCGYALLDIWKCMEISSMMSKESLTFIMQRIINSSISAQEIMSLKKNHKYLSGINIYLKGANRKLLFFMLVLIICFSLITIASIHFIGWDSRLLFFLKKYSIEIGIISGLVTIIITALGIFKSIKSKKMRNRRG